MRKNSNKEEIKSRVVRVNVNPKFVVYIDEWYLEELVDILKEYPEKEYFNLIKKLADKNKSRLENFPQQHVMSHRVSSKKDKFNEYETMEEYINETWFSNSKVSLLKVNNLKKMHVKLKEAGSVPSVPSYLNNITPYSMLSFHKEKSDKFKTATILLNISGHMNWQSYRTIIRSFFKQYDFNALSIGNIAHTNERGIDYYRLSIVKVRNGVNVNGQGLMLESADFLRRIMFMIYEIDPTTQVWKSYGKTLLNKDIEELKKKEPYFASILTEYLNPSIILVE